MFLEKEHNLGGNNGSDIELSEVGEPSSSTIPELESVQSDIDDSKSNSGYVFTLNGGAVSWKSFKQDTTTDSTIVAEYIAAAEAAKEGVWMKKFIKHLGVIPSSMELTPIYCDSGRVITLAREPRSQQNCSEEVPSD
ncbi:hypothetical protein OPV22_032312 [Ensete ventricosum]|uniref:Reverse transcriptase Ty1/copia-type domain-containing protein n=1 Tax=Ensete ventricosum TaxID=4639 RepID=A0AAV8NZZ9_ENSVE|nr:hypothetical protein OPV22_032312 [Ensete ventricosum]